MNSRLFVLFTFFFAMLLFPVTSLAAPEITVDASAGFQNKVKYEKGAPVQISVSNSGSAFSGDLVLSYSESYNLGAGISVPLELTAGESKTLQLAVPGLSDRSYMGGAQSQAQTIFLYEGGWEEGDSIEFSGTKSLSPGFSGPASLFIMTLTDNPDRLLKLDRISPAGSEMTEVVHLNQLENFELPADAVAWDAADYLVIDEFAYSDLSSEVQTAILQWIRQGGHVLVGSAENMSALMGNLNEFLPLELNGTAQLAVSGLEEQVPGFTASLKEGASAVMEHDGEILAARQSVGAGALTQVSFSLGDETVSAQDGYEGLIGSFFSLDTNSVNSLQGGSIKERISYEIGNSNELFESFAVSGTLIAAIIILYIILIVPVLYTVLKKRDKREYAWVIIPAIAVITSIGLFAAGAKDRIASPQIQQTGFFEVDADSGLSGYYMNSLLSNRGGEYQFTAPETTTMTSVLDSQFSDELPHLSAIVEKGAGKTTLTMRDMRYWSVASIIGQSYIENTGKFDINLNLENKVMTGSVKNNFPFAVQDAAIWTGTRLLQLGDMSPGEQLDVNLMVQSDALPAAAPISQSYGYQSISNKEDLMESRKQSALAMSYENLSNKESSPYLIAYTNDAIVPVTLENQRASVSPVHLIAQSFEPATTVSEGAEE